MNTDTEKVLKFGVFEFVRYILPFGLHCVQSLYNHPAPCFNTQLEADKSLSRSKVLNSELFEYTNFSQKNQWARVTIRIVTRREYHSVVMRFIKVIVNSQTMICLPIVSKDCTFFVLLDGEDFHFHSKTWVLICPQTLKLLNWTLPECCCTCM